MSRVQDKLKEVFEVTADSGIKFEGDISKLDYYTLFCKAASKDKLYKIIGNHVCMFNCEYNNSDAVLMIFFIPINSEDSGAKNVAERVMEVVDLTENCFISIDFLKSEEVKEDKFIYVTVVKKIDDEKE